MKNKILLANLILFFALFLWYKTTKTENTSTATSYNVSSTKEEKQISSNKNRLTNISKPTSIKLQIVKTADNTIPASTTTTAYLSLADILQALENSKNNKELNSIALLLKSQPCQDCIELLKQIIANSELNNELRTRAAVVLAKIGTRQSIVTLIHALNKKTISVSESNLLQQITTESISAIYESEGIAALAYILTGQQTGMPINQLPAPLVSNMNKAITSFSDKNGVAFEMTKQYWTTQRPEVQNAIIELNHPQTLAALAMEAQEFGDITLQNKVIEKLIANPNSATLDALMSLTEKSLKQFPDLPENINDWVQANIKTDREGHLIDYLSNPSATPIQRQIAVEVLSNLTQIPNLVSEQENIRIQDAVNKYHHYATP